MSDSTELTQTCPKCEGRFKFPAEGKGMEVNCPLCDLIIKLDGRTTVPPSVKSPPNSTENASPILKLYPLFGWMIWWPMKPIPGALLGGFYCFQIIDALASLYDQPDVLVFVLLIQHGLISVVRAVIQKIRKQPVIGKPPTVEGSTILPWFHGNPRIVHSYALVIGVSLLISVGFGFKEVADGEKRLVTARAKLSELSTEKDKLKGWDDPVNQLGALLTQGSGGYKKIDHQVKERRAGLDLMQDLSRMGIEGAESKILSGKTRRNTAATLLALLVVGLGLLHLNRPSEITPSKV